MLRYPLYSLSTGRSMVEYSPSVQEPFGCFTNHYPLCR